MNSTICTFYQEALSMYIAIPDLSLCTTSLDTLLLSIHLCLTANFQLQKHLPWSSHSNQLVTFIC